jgi:hypothetical protein
MHSKERCADRPPALLAELAKIAGIEDAGPRRVWLQYNLSPVLTIGFVISHHLQPCTSRMSRSILAGRAQGYCFRR